MTGVLLSGVFDGVSVLAVPALAVVMITWFSLLQITKMFDGYGASGKDRKA